MQIFVCFILILCLKSLQWLLFFNQFVRFTSCDGEFSALRSTMELKIPHGFLKRSVLKVLEMINKSQHKWFQSKSRRYWKFKIAVIFMFNVWELQHKNDSLMYKYIWNIMLKRHNILPARTSFFISSAEKLKTCGNSKCNFLSSCLQMTVI